MMNRSDVSQTPFKSTKTKASRSNPASVNQTASFHRFRIGKPTSDGAPGSGPGHHLRVPSDSGSQSSIQVVCHRCRRLKKKCSRTKPTCVQCHKADSVCSFSEDLIASPRQVRTGSVQALQSQIALLQQRLTNTSHDFDVLGGASSGTLMHPSPMEGQGSLASPPMTLQAGQSVQGAREARLQTETVVELEGSPDLTAINEAASSLQRLAGNVSEAPRPLSTLAIETEGRNPSLPRLSIGESAAVQFVDAYFRHIHRMYPFMDRVRVLEDLKSSHNALNGMDELPMKLFLVMAIGCTTLRRIGRVSEGAFTRFKVPYQTVMAECLAKLDMESVETLLLLFMYSLYDPVGVSPWTICGILSSHVTQLGFGRQPLAGTPSDIAERRKRLFWSVFSMDRLKAVATGMPFSLQDEKTNITLPSLTAAESESSTKDFFSRVLHVNRHLINLRQLEEKVLRKTHFTVYQEQDSFTNTGRRLAVNELRTQSDDWYSQGCLLVPYETDSMPYHTTANWLSHRLQGLLLMLHTPSRYSSSISKDHYGELQSCVKKYIQISSVLQKQRQLAFNWVTLCSTIALCPILLYCMVRATDGINHVRTETGLCANILDLFPGTWEKARKGADVFRTLAGVIMSNNHPRRQLDDEIIERPTLRTAFVEVEVLVRETLGASSFWYEVLEAVSDLINERSEYSTPEQAIPEPYNMIDAWMIEEPNDLWAGYGNLGLEFV
ncbi:hypothetical protein BP6252_05057 [Coleophoma cylindrospora]|uniref:Zn(2)-C6 fungal-type domain-containing protein n=1 Tax=Coleophoma cylindrospora TaxID=1849047 RepID=A0A3D8RT06_9HELO|nr:hypothetical protein BP6252_05057 [Coleophoma cylindrospora]